MQVPPQSGGFCMPVIETRRNLTKNSGIIHGMQNLALGARTCMPYQNPRRRTRLQIAAMA